MKLQAALTFTVCLILAIACTSRPATQAPSPLPSPSQTPTPPPSPTPTSPPPATGEFNPTSPREITGIWDSQVLYERGYHHFREDGTLVIAYSYEELETNPVFSTPAKFWFEGTTFHVEDTCGHGTYILTLTRKESQNQKLSFKLLKDPCEQRTIDWKKPMQWVKP